MSIGQRVRKRRRALELSQEEVARRAGITTGVVWRLETGRIKDPHFSTLTGLANALGVAVEDLIKEEKPPVPLAI